MKASFHQLPAAIESAARNSRVELIGFDVFDTLLRRRTEPETVKDLVARRLVQLLSGLPLRRGISSQQPLDWRLLREKRRQLEIELGHLAENRGLDHEFHLREMMMTWVRRCAPPEINDREAESYAAELVRHEILCEHAAAAPTPDIVQALETAQRHAQRIVFVSDSYMSLADISGLLRAQSLIRFFRKGYVSSEFMLTKRSGRLFERVLRDEQVDPSAMLFIGDNPYADIAAAKSMGIRTIHVSDVQESARRARLRLLDSMSRRNQYWTGRHAREIIEAIPVSLARTNEQSRDPHYRLGAMLAPGFVAFTLHVLEMSQQLGLRRIYFLSREGLTFCKIYRRLVRALGLSGIAPKAEYVVVSRASTFLASCDTFDLATLKRIWAQYDGQSLSRILRNFSLPLEEMRPFAAAAGIDDLDRPIMNLDAEPGLTGFLEDRNVRDIFVRERDKARSLFTGYMRQRGWFDCAGSGAVGVVDIGWKGSIQNNIFRALRGLEGAPAIHGLYFGLMHQPAEDHPRNTKRGYMADTRSADWISESIFKNGSVFEMFSTAMHGSAIGYVETPTGGVRAVTAIDDTERANFRTYFARVNRGMNDYIRDFMHVLPLIDYTSTELRPDFLDSLRRYILYPDRAEAKAFLKYTHVENFGVFKITDYRWRGSWRTILLGDPRLILSRAVAELRKHIWAEAIVKRSALPFGNLVYDLVETKNASRYIP